MNKIIKEARFPNAEYAIEVTLYSPDRGDDPYRIWVFDTDKSAFEGQVVLTPEAARQLRDHLTEMLDVLDKKQPDLP